MLTHIDLKSSMMSYKAAVQTLHLTKNYSANGGCGGLKKEVCLKTFLRPTTVSDFVGLLPMTVHKWWWIFPLNDASYMFLH